MPSRCSYAIAGTYAFQAQTGQAFKWSGRAYAIRDSGLLEMKTGPMLDNLRNDPRYAALLKNDEFI